MGDVAGLVQIVLVLSAGLQIAAAVVAVALIPLSGMRRSWSVVALAMLLQAVRRMYLIGAGTSLADALLALAISMLLLAGIIGMRSVFLTLAQTTGLLAAERRNQDDFAGRAGALLVLLDVDGRIRDVNGRAGAVLGSTAEELRGKVWFDTFVPEESRAEIADGFRRFVASADSDDEYVEYEIRDTAGDAHTCVWHRRALRDERGRVVGVRSAGIDLTEQRALEEELAFRSILLDHTNDAVLVYAFDGRILYANDRARLYRGGQHDDIVGADIHQLLLPDDREVFDAHVEDMAAGSCLTFETTGSGSDGVARPLESHSCPLTLNGRELVIEVARDVTERRKAESAIRHMAHSDPLTGLPNRVMLYDRARLAIARARRGGTALAVLFLDLDSMKAVNDGFGHAAGDELLQLIAERLGDAFRGEDTVARIGGDEFVVLAEVEAASQAEGVVARVDAVMRDAFRLETGPVDASFSVGVALFPRDSERFEDLLAKADAAMYRVKAEKQEARRDLGSRPGRANGSVA